MLGSGHGDDDLAARVSLLQVAQAGSALGQGEGPVEHRCEVPCLDEFGDGEQVLPRPGLRQRSEPLTDERVDGCTTLSASGARVLGERTLETAEYLVPMLRPARP